MIVHLSYQADICTTPFKNLLLFVIFQFMTLPEYQYYKSRLSYYGIRLLFYAIMNRYYID